MLTTYTVKYKVYDGFGFVGINTWTGKAAHPVTASKQARATIAGQYATKLLSIHDDTSDNKIYPEDWDRG